MQILSLVLAFFFVVSASEQSKFNGQIVYKFEGWGEFGVDSITYLIGDDFYFERRGGSIMEKQPWLNSDFLLDISSRTHYYIKDDEINSKKLEVTEITTFYDFEVVDTVTYFGYECKVITFLMKNTFNGYIDSYKYYYPIGIELPDLYSEIPKFFSSKNTFFRPFNESFLPLYIESKDSDGENVKCIRVVKMDKQPVDRDDYFYIFSKE